MPARLVCVFLVGVGAALTVGCASTAPAVATAPAPCPEIRETWAPPPPLDAETGPRPNIEFSIFDSTVSENRFAIGALLRNRSANHYAFGKTDAKIHFTRYASGRGFESIPYSPRNLVVSADITITSWEDGESPALRLSPCQEKWIRVQGSLNKTQVRRFAEGDARQASIQLFRLLSYGWGSGPSETFALERAFIDGVKRYCKEAAGCE